jgi:hypothetical protein
MQDSRLVMKDLFSSNPFKFLFGHQSSSSSHSARLLIHLLTGYWKVLPLVTLNSVRSQIIFLAIWPMRICFTLSLIVFLVAYFFNMLLFPFSKEGGRNGWLIRCLHYLAWTKKTMIVDVIIVNSVMWAEGWERGEWGSCYQTGDQSGWEFATMSKKLALQVSWGFLLFCKTLNKTVCTLCKY